MSQAALAESGAAVRYGKVGSACARNRLTRIQHRTLLDKPSKVKAAGYLTKLLAIRMQPGKSDCNLPKLSATKPEARQRASSNNGQTHSRLG